MRASDARDALALIDDLLANTQSPEVIHRMVAEVFEATVQAKITGREPESGQWHDSQCVLWSLTARMPFGEEEARTALRRISEVRATETPGKANKALMATLQKALRQLAKEPKQKIPVKYRGQSLEV